MSQRQLRGTNVETWNLLYNLNLRRKLTLRMKSLGERIRELRESRDLSLRELARNIQVTASFLSDIELGRRFPSEDVLEKLAQALQIDAGELRRLDHRQPIADLKGLMETNPALGFAFRTALEDVKGGKISSEELIERLIPKKKKGSGDA